MTRVLSTTKELMEKNRIDDSSTFHNKVFLLMTVVPNKPFRERTDVEEVEHDNLAFLLLQKIGFHHFNVHELFINCVETIYTLFH